MTIEIVQTEDIITIEDTQDQIDCTIVHLSSGQFEITTNDVGMWVLSREMMIEVRDWINERLR